MKVCLGLLSFALCANLVAEPLSAVSVGSSLLKTARAEVPHDLDLAGLSDNDRILAWQVALCCNLSFAPHFPGCARQVSEEPRRRWYGYVHDLQGKVMSRLAGKRLLSWTHDRAPLPARTDIDPASGLDDGTVVAEWEGGRDEGVRHPVRVSRGDASRKLGGVGEAADVREIREGRDVPARLRLGAGEVEGRTRAAPRRPAFVELRLRTPRSRAVGARGGEETRMGVLLSAFPRTELDAQGCGSDLSVQDIADGIAHLCSRGGIDRDRVYLVGGSGGGHMAFLMAGRHPELFAAVYAACPITDVGRWHVQSRDATLDLYPHYADMLEKVCGGTYAEKKAEYDRRSPVTYLANAKNLAVDIIPGIHDGHKRPKNGGSVPCGHAIRGFNAVADEQDRIPEEAIAEMERTEKVPEAYAWRGSDPFFRVPDREIYLRRVSGNVRLTLFNAGHAGNYAAAADWFTRQKRGRPADWTIPAGMDGSLSETAHEITK